MTEGIQDGPRAAAVLVAAGRSTRMQLPEGVRKPLLRLEGRTVLEHAAAAFAACPAVRELVVVCLPEDEAAVRELAARSPALERLTAVVPGGAERTDSVLAGVRATGEGAELVAVHDAARPLVRPEVVAAALALAAREGAAVVAVPVSDTIKHSVDGVHADRTLDRSTLWAAQTPQVFRRATLLELLEHAAREGRRSTDDAALWELGVGPVPLVRGDSTNLKITTPTDLEVAAAILRARAAGLEDGATDDGARIR